MTDPIDPQLARGLRRLLDAGETLLAAFAGHGPGAGGSARALVCVATDRWVAVHAGSLWRGGRVGRRLARVPLAGLGSLAERDGYLEVGGVRVGAHLDDPGGLARQRMLVSAVNARATRIGSAP